MVRGLFYENVGNAVRGDLCGIFPSDDMEREIQSLLLFLLFGIIFSVQCGEGERV